MSEAEPGPKLSAVERHKQRLATAAVTVVSDRLDGHPAPKFVRPNGDAPDNAVTPKTSLAMRHRARFLTAAAIALAGHGAGLAAPDRREGTPEASAYQLLMAALDEDLRSLSDLRSVDHKIEAKRQMIAKYDDHVLTVLAAAADTGQALRDEVFVTMMIWRLDICDYGMALDMAEHVLKYGLALPQRYNRTAPTLIAEEPADAALKAASLDLPFDLPILQRVADLVKGQDINGIVCAKLQRALGEQFLRIARTTEDTADGPAGARRAALGAAEAHFKEALRLHDKCGVKKPLAEVQALLKKEPASEPDA